ncbi:MAG: DUF5050 domain-containing protein [Clostridia bacterium]|nr:DUF5050 domain-containing protein [Clostridia bacterium]
MKRIVILFVLFITVMASFSSCTQPAENTYMGGSSYVYDNVLYFTEHNYLKYTRLDTGKTAILCYDPLCKHDTEDCIAYLPYGFFYHLVVDEASSKNGVVLYVSCCYRKSITDFDQVHGIARIDIAEGKREMFANGLACSAINQISIVGDKFYFIATNTDDYYYKIFSLDRNGRGLTQLTETSEINYLLCAIEDGYFYYSDDFGNIYRTTDFTTQELLYTSKHHYGFYIHGGYLYYADDEVYELNENPDLPAYDYQTGEWGHYRWTTRSYTYYRIPLDNPSAEPEAVVDGALGTQLMLFTDTHMYAISVAHKYLGMYTVYDPELKMELPEYVAVRTDGVLKVDLATLEVEKIAIKDDWDIFSVISADEEQIVFRGDHQRSNLEKQMHTGSKYVVYNMKDKTYTIME